MCNAGRKSVVGVHQKGCRLSHVAWCLPGGLHWFTVGWVDLLPNVARCSVSERSCNVASTLTTLTRREFLLVYSFY